MKDLASQLKQVKTVAIAGHVKPDGDCVGSCLATYNYIAASLINVRPWELPLS